MLATYQLINISIGFIERYGFFHHKIEIANLIELKVKICPRI